MNILNNKQAIITLQDLISDIKVKLRIYSDELEHNELLRDHITVQYHRILDLFPKNLFQEVFENSNLIERWNKTREIKEAIEMFPKIEEIRKHILFSSPKIQLHPEAFTNSSLNWQQTIDEFEKIICPKMRLPFRENLAMEIFQEEVIANLQIDDPAKAEKIQKKIFHLLADYPAFSQKLQGMKLSRYSSSEELSSLETWSEILNLLARETKGLQQIKIKMLLQSLEKAKPLSKKIGFFNAHSHILKSSNAHKNTSYFEDILKLEVFEENGTFHISPSSEFLEKYTLSISKKAVQNIPENVFINDMAWDVIESIQALKRKELSLYLLGPSTHSIAVEIRCVQEKMASSESEDGGKYQCKIYNTGEGAEEHHPQSPNEDWACPLIIEDLSLKAFSYSFIADLLRVAVKSENTDDFYRLIKTRLIIEAGGKIAQASQENPYPLQPKGIGICTYKVVEVWLKSFMSQTLCKRFDQVIAEFAINQQQQAYELLNQDSVEASTSLFESAKQYSLLKQTIFSPTTKKKTSLKRKANHFDLSLKVYKQVKLISIAGVFLAACQAHGTNIGIKNFITSSDKAKIDRE